MHVIIVGCGRVGSTLANQLTQGGHDVVVIDRQAESLRRLGDGFTGRTVVGVGFDREVLQQAGITESSRVAAVTSGDNSNILIARVARELFGAVHVVARIYDPQRATVYERLGIATVASVSWTVGRITNELLPQQQSPTWSDPTSTVRLIEFRVPANLAGESVSAVESIVHGRAISITRNGAAQLAQSGTLVQENDLIHVAIHSNEAIADVIDHLANPSREH